MNYANIISRDKSVTWVNFALVEHGHDDRDFITMFPARGRFAFLENLRDQIDVELERLLALSDPEVKEVENGKT